MYVPVTIPNICKCHQFWIDTCVKLAMANSSLLAYMNWSCVIVGATIVLPGIYWIFSARHKYLKDSNSVLTDNVIVVDGVAKSAAEVLGIEAKDKF
jgi:hypothetical protein